MMCVWKLAEVQHVRMQGNSQDFSNMQINIHNVSLCSIDGELFAVCSVHGVRAKVMEVVQIEYPHAHIFIFFF